MGRNFKYTLTANTTHSVLVKRSHGVIDSQYLGLDAQKTKAVRQLTLQIILLTHSRQLRGVNSRHKHAKILHCPRKIDLKSNIIVISDATFLECINIAVWKVQKPAHSGQKRRKIGQIFPAPYVRTLWRNVVFSFFLWHLGYYTFQKMSLGAIEFVWFSQSFGSNGCKKTNFEGNCLANGMRYGHSLYYVTVGNTCVLSGFGNIT